MVRDPAQQRRHLEAARLLLLFTPDLCGPRDPLDQVRALLGAVDLIQVRPKPVGGSSAPAPARETLDWARRILTLIEAMDDPPLIFVDDRVDVARLLLAEGLAGVHLGADDMPPAEAREFLGSDALIGLSTHSLRDVIQSEDLPVDYLGFGPIYDTHTKGLAGRLGPEQAWIAASTSSRPVFPIGGIDVLRASELEQVGRAAVGSALLSAPDPEAVARELHWALGQDY